MRFDGEALSHGASQNNAVSDRRRPSILRELWWALPRLGRAGQGKAVGVLTIWIWWDRFLQRRWRLTKVRERGVLRYRIGRHRGPPVTLEDGTHVMKSDLILELHFDNAGLMNDSRGAGWSPWDAMEAISADLDELARLVAAGHLRSVRAFHGVTLFSAPARRLGFERHPVRHTIGWSLRRYFLIGLLPIYHRQGWKEFDRMRRDRWPAELWMSADRLPRRNEAPG
jgi:hypothetical protein